MNAPTKAGRSKRSKAAKMLTPAQLFFYDHAGYSYGKDETPEQGRIRCARTMADGEEKAANLNWTLSWDYDSECIGCDCGSTECKCSTGEPHETLWCWIEDENGR